jgi:hypothetical protein
METEIEKVKRKIWSFGYACKSIPSAPGIKYDLIVENTFLLKVVNRQEDVLVNDNTISFALVDGDEIKYFISKGRNRWDLSDSPLKAFPKN